MKEQKDSKEKTLQIMNLYAINKYVQKMIVARTKKLTLKSESGDRELVLLEDFSNIIALDNSRN